MKINCPASTPMFRKSGVEVQNKRSPDERSDIGDAPDAFALARPIPSALMRSPHHLHGVLDMAPLFGFVGVALALASHGIPRRLGDSLEAVLLEHLPRNRVNLHLGYHVALLMRRPRNHRDRYRLLESFKRSNRGLVPCVCDGLEICSRLQQKARRLAGLSFIQRC